MVIYGDGVIGGVINIIICGFVFEFFLVSICLVINIDFDSVFNSLGRMVE